VVKYSEVDINRITGDGEPHNSKCYHSQTPASV